MYWPCFRPDVSVKYNLSNYCLKIQIYTLLPYESEPEDCSVVAPASSVPAIINASVGDCFYGYVNYFMIVYNETYGTDIILYAKEES